MDKEVIILSKPQEKTVSRRKFLIGGLASTIVAGTTVMGVNLSGDKAANAATGPPQRWDAEADVVVVGFGIGGGAAAVSAADKGASVLVLESMPVPGGTTRVSGGGLWLPNNSVMKAQGYSDSPEEARAYMLKGNNGQVEEELIEVYIENAPKIADYMQNQLGIKWSLGLPDYHPEWPGGKRIGRHLAPSYKEKSGGEAIMAAFYDYAVSKGVKFALNTHAKHLIQDNSGAVVGVVAYQNGKEIKVKANKGVVLATGGFEWDQRYMKNFQRGPAVASVTFNPASGGGTIYGASDGLRMAMEVGADLRNMNESWGLMVYLLPGWEEEVANYRKNAKSYKNRPWKKIIGDWFIWRGKPGSIIVNKSGERFMNEACDYDTSVYPFYHRDTFGENEWRNVPAFVIVDSNMYNKFGLAGAPAGSEPPAYITKANTLKELAEKLGIDPEGLQATVTTFNKYASENPPRDPFFHRGESYFDRMASGDISIVTKDPEDPAACLAPLTKGPYYGIQIHPSNCGTCGGPRVNGKAQVINTAGEVIPGLYAAGNVTGLGGPGITYMGPGSPLGGGAIFGYLAGSTASSQK